MPKRDSTEQATGREQTVMKSLAAKRGKVVYGMTSSDATTASVPRSPEKKLINKTGRSTTKGYSQRLLAQARARNTKLEQELAQARARNTELEKEIHQQRKRVAQHDAEAANATPEHPAAACTPRESLREVAALRRLDKVKERRAIAQLAQEGWSQVDIARFAGVSQPHISRTLSLLYEHPEVLEPTAQEIVWRRCAGVITSEKMMSELSSWNWTFGQMHDDAWEPGDWDDMAIARAEGFLSDDEHRQLAEQVTTR